MTIQDNGNPWRGNVGPWGPRRPHAGSRARGLVAGMAWWLRQREELLGPWARAFGCIGVGCALTAVAVPSVALIAGLVGVWYFAVGAGATALMKLQGGVRLGLKDRSLSRDWLFWTVLAALLVAALLVASAADQAPSPAPAEVAPAQRSIAE